MRYYWYCIHLCICPDNLRPYGDKSAKQSALSSKVNNLGCNLRCHSIPVYAYINHSVARNAPKTMVYKTYCSYTYDSIHFFALTYCSIKKPSNTRIRNTQVWEANWNNAGGTPHNHRHQGGTGEGGITRSLYVYKHACIRPNWRVSNRRVRSSSCSSSSSPSSSFPSPNQAK